MTSAAVLSTSRSCGLHDGIFEVLATHGDTHLGGDDIDNLLLQIAQEDIATEGITLSVSGVQALRQEVIRAKEALCPLRPA